MKLLFENWRRYLHESGQEEIFVALPPINSSVRYNIQDGGDLPPSEKIPHPFNREYTFFRILNAPFKFYFGGPSGLSLNDIDTGTRGGGVGAPQTRRKEAGLYVTKSFEDAKKRLNSFNKEVEDAGDKHDDLKDAALKYHLLEMLYQKVTNF